MKKIYLLIAVTIILGIFANSAMASTYSAERELVNKQQEQYRIAQPIPYFDWSLERFVTIKLYEARNQQVATYSIWRADSGKIEGDCPSTGYPIPYDTQLTNPLQALYSDWTDGSPVVEQPEPNGLYSSKNSMATWVRCIYNINGKTVEAPIYIEGKVTTYPYPVTVNYTSNRVKPVENVMPSVVIQHDGNASK